MGCSHCHARSAICRSIFVLCTVDLLLGDEGKEKKRGKERAPYPDRSRRRDLLIANRPNSGKKGGGKGRADSDEPKPLSGIGQSSYFRASRGEWKGKKRKTGGARLERRH